MSSYVSASVPGKTMLEMICPYEPGKPIEEVKRELGLESVIKLASNENPMGPSQRVIDTLNQSTLDLHLYPDCEGWYLREALAKHFDVPNNTVVLGPGSADLMRLIADAYLEPGTEGIVSDICFPVYKNVTAVAGAKAVVVPLNESLDYDLERMLDAVTSRTRVVFLASPNNPTGRLVPFRDIAAFIERLPPRVLLVLDLAYWEYVEHQPEEKPTRLLREYPNVMALRTFSKVYGLAGLRIGYGIANAHVIESLRRVRVPFSTSTAAQVAARAAIADQEHIRDAVALNTRSREAFRTGLEAIGLEPLRSEANFILVRVGKQPDWIFERLLTRGIIVRPVRTPRLADCIRITTGTEEQTSIALAAIEELAIEAPEIRRT